MFKIFERRLEGWTTRDYVTKIPPVIGGIFVLLIAIIFSGDTGMIAVSTMFALIVGSTPYAFYSYFRMRDVRAMEDQLPNFLRDLVEGKKSGMTLPQALSTTSHTDYGELSKEIKKMYHQLSWGVPFSKVLSKFAERVKESEIIDRSMRIVIEAHRSGGDVVSTMETIASDASIIKEAEKERKSRTSQHVIIMYLIYFMFLGIVILLARVLIQMVSMGDIGTLSSSFGGIFSANPCLSPSENIRFVCNFFNSLAIIFGLGTGLKGYYNALFFSMVMMQGTLSGLVAGQIGEDSVSAGVKHSLILTVVGFIVFILVTRMGLI